MDLLSFDKGGKSKNSSDLLSNNSTQLTFEQLMGDISFSTNTNQTQNMSKNNNSLI